MEKKLDFDNLATLAKENEIAVTSAKALNIINHLGGLNAMIQGCLCNEEYLQQNGVYTEEKYSEIEKLLTSSDDGIEDRKDESGDGVVTLPHTNTEEFDKKLEKSHTDHIPKFGAVLIYCSIVLGIFILNFAFYTGVGILIIALFSQWIISVCFALIRSKSISALRIINRKIDGFDSNMIFPYNMLQIYNLPMQSISEFSGVRGSTLYYVMLTNTSVVAGLFTMCLYNRSNEIININGKLTILQGVGIISGNLAGLGMFLLGYFELNGHSKLYAIMHYVGIGLCGQGLILFGIIMKLNITFWIISSFAALFAIIYFVVTFKYGKKQPNVNEFEGKYRVHVISIACIASETAFLVMTGISYVTAIFYLKEL